MEALVASFPCLRKAVGGSPWDAFRFARWATQTELSPADRQAAAFVLAVWNGGDEDGAWWNEKPYGVGRFDLVLATALWDRRHKEAFGKWFANPFWP